MGHARYTPSMNPAATTPLRSEKEFAPAHRSAVRALALILLALLCVPGCHRKDEFRPSKLLPPLRSGYSLRKVQAELKLKPGDWQVLEDRRPLVSDQRPEFRMLTLLHPSFTKFGTSGELVMTFYNDRLMTTLFYPDDMAALRSGLAREAGITFSAQGDARIEPTTRVWVGKSRDGRSYIGWIDLELERQQNAWIEKYER